MQDEKKKRIIAAATVAAVLLVVILFAVVVYQIIDISVLKSRKARLETEYSNILEQIDEGGDWLEQFELNEDKILYQLALQYGYRPR